MFGGTPDMPPGPAAVPGRPYLGLSPAGAQELLDLAERYLKP
jgi:phage gpG-like protein